MKSFQEYLTDNGFTPYRKTYSKTNGHQKISLEDADLEPNSFSTMVSGGCEIFYEKNGLEICWGLNEAGLPPILIYPLPYSLRTDKNNLGHMRDAETYQILRNHSNEEILKAIMQ